MPRLLALALVAALAGCDGAVGLDAGSPDGGRTDAGSTDAGSVDAGSEDAGLDAGLDAGPGEPSLAVLSLNLHCLRTDGTAHPDNPARFAAIAAVVASERVDAIALQEVCDDGSADALAMLEAAVEGATGAGWDAHRIFAHVAWEGTADEADESVAILARALSAPTTLTHRVQSGLTRVAAAADVGSALGAVRLTSVHFDNVDATARRAQAREAAVVSLSEADPGLRAVVAGDFNARRGSDALVAFEDSGFVHASDAVASGRIDHVFAHRGAGLRVLEARVLFETPTTAVSDHPAVLVRFGAEAAPALRVTRLIALHDPGVGRHLSVRGSAAPLSWTEGWPMHARAPGQWRFVSTELSGALELKTLIDDTNWQMGANVPANAGEDTTFTPSF